MSRRHVSTFRGRNRDFLAWLLTWQGPARW